MAEFMYGSICLSTVPKELFKIVKCKDGVDRVFLNIAVKKRKKKSKFGHTHFVSCEPKNKEERKDGVTYIIGDLTEYVANAGGPTPEDINNAPSASDDALPF